MRVTKIREEEREKQTAVFKDEKLDTINKQLNSQHSILNTQKKSGFSYVKKNDATQFPSVKPSPSVSQNQFLMKNKMRKS